MVHFYCAGQRWLILMALWLGVSLVVSGQAPTITGVLPTRNAYAAGANSLQSITFSQLMSGAPGSTGSVRMFGSLVGGRKAGTGSAVTNKLGFNPTVAANAGERISTTVTTAAQSSGGFNLATGQVTQFTAAAGGTGQGFFGEGAGLGIASIGAVIPDIDGDGDLDLLSLQPDGVVGVYRNTGSGGMVFHASLTNGAGLTLVSPQTADVDADGDMDLLIGDALNSQVLLWKNNGAGTFTLAGVISTGLGQIKELRLNDFDADGDLDLAISHSYQTGVPLVRIFANNGTGVFTLFSTFIHGTDTPVSLETGDLDNDGDLDLLLLARLSNIASTAYLLPMLNNGSGTFNLGTLVYVPVTPEAVRLADLDHDGDLDAAVGYNNAFRLYTNNGLGTLGNTPLVATILVSTQTFDWQVADVNADGWTDLLYTSLYGFLLTSVGCLLGGPGPAWAQQRLTTFFPSVLPSVRLAPGDLDGDGDIDLLAYDGLKVVQLYNEPVMQILPLTPLANARNVPVSEKPLLKANQYIKMHYAFGAGTRILVFSAQAGGRRTGATQTDGLGQFTPYADFRPGEVVSVSATTANVSYPANIAPPRGLVYQFTTAATGGLGFFSAAASLPTGAAPNGVCAADFNGDGLLDEATTNATGASVTVRLGTGGGAFGLPGTFALAGTTPRGLAAGDIDNDGDLDLAVTTGLNSPSVSVRFLINAGNATFAFGAGLVIPGNPQEPALADVNADGNLDLLTANFFGSASIRLGNGAGAFSGSQSIVMATPCTSIAVGDVDNDGDLDLVAGSYGGGAVGIRLNDGLGTFSLTGADLPTLGEPRNVALADITADGILDIIVAGDGVERAVGLGGGAFAGFIAVGGTGTQVNDVATGDIDADGDLDILASTTSPAQVKAYLNTGFGLSYTAGAIIPVGASVLNLTTADLDNDGDIDFLASSTGNSTVNVLLNQNGPPPLPTPPVLTATAPTSHQPFVQPTTNLAFTFDQLMSNAPASVGSPRVFGAETGRRTGAGTVTGNAINFNPTTDFRPGELVSVTMTTNAQATNNFPLNPLPTPHVHQFRAGVGGGLGQFNGSWQQTLAGGSRGAAAADIDGDGDVDGLVVAFGANAVQLYLNPGGGNPFTVGASVPVGNGPNGIVAADVDADGDVDFVVANQTSSTVSVCLNNGAGVFGAAVAVPVGAGPIGVAVGDLDGDGDLDLATANNAAGASVCFNAGNGTFGPATAVSVGSSPTGISLTDVNNDGDLDLLTCNLGSSNVSVCQNNGAGVFGAATTVAVGANPTGLTLGDVDNDGDPDLLTADNTAGTVSVCLNTGGAFGAATAVAAGFSPRAVVLADADGDGDLDLLATTQNATSTLCLNNGVGTFGSVIGVALPGASYGLASADLDNDGDIDWLSANFNGGVAVRYNEYPDLIISNPMNVPPGPWHNITVTGTGNGTLSGNTTVTGAVVVQPGGGWNDGCFVLSGPGSFTLQAGGQLFICNQQGISASGPTGGIQVTGARSFSPGADYEYYWPFAGTQLTGTGLTGARNLTNNASNDLTLTGATSVSQMLTVTAGAGNFSLNGQNLTLLSSNAGTAMVVNAGAGAVTGSTAIVQRFLTPVITASIGYRHLSAPVSGSTVTDLTVPGLGGFIPVVNPAFDAQTNPTPSPFPTVYGFNETLKPTSPIFGYGWFSPTALSNPLKPGRGYSAYIKPLTPDFNGTLGNGPVAVSPLTVTGAFLGAGQKSGWHLLGNPYPAPINWDLVTPGPGPGQLPTGMSGAIYVQQSTGGQNGIYLTRAGGVGSLTNGYVPMAQGFFVRAVSNAPLTFTFTNALRLTSYANPLHYRPASATGLSAVLGMALRRTNAPAGALASETFVAFRPDATTGFDLLYDAPLPGYNAGEPTLLTISAPADELAINALPDTYPAPGAAPVEMVAVLPAAGSYKLTVSDWRNLPAGVAILDRLTATHYPLDSTTTVQFSVSAAGAVRGRFALVFGGPLGTDASVGTSHTSLIISPNPAAGRATVTLLGTAATRPVVLLDNVGRVVRRLMAPTNIATELDLRGLATGVYTVRAESTAPVRLVVE